MDSNTRAIRANARVIRRLNDRVDAKISAALVGVPVPIMSLASIRKAALEAIAHATDIDRAITTAIERVRVTP